MIYTPDAIRRIRRRAKLTQAALAAHLEVTTQTVKNWEGGRRGVARRYHAELDALADAPAAPADRVNSRPRFADLAPEDWAATSKYGWCELKYDGEYGEIRGGPGGWTATNRRGRTITLGSEPLPVCHLLVEHITGTEWARSSGLFGSCVVWAALSTQGIHLSRLDLMQLVNALKAAGMAVVASERHDIAAASTLWDYAVMKRGWEGLVLRTAGGKFARMKCRVTMDYVCTGSNGDSLIGALYNTRSKLIDRVSVPCPDDARVGQVFEASGLAVTERGSLRNPRWERWRDDKPAAECTTSV